MAFKLWLSFNIFSFVLRESYVKFGKVLKFQFKACQHQMHNLLQAIMDRYGNIRFLYLPMAAKKCCGI